MLDTRSVELRKTIVKVLAAAGRGHLGASFSLVEIVRVLFDDVMRYDPQNPRWPGRDRFILSKGHGCVALYVLLAEKGFFPTEELWKFCRFDGMLGGHPDPKVPGVECATGSLGHGLSIGVGMALNARYEGSGGRVFVVLGDGECNEGSVWEAAMSAGKHKLDNLVALVDYNEQQSYGSTHEILDLEPFADKWRSCGFDVTEVDGHDVAALKAALLGVRDGAGKPMSVICHTVKGKGVGFAENNPAWHHKSKLKDDDVQKLLSALGSP
ncbi:MAG: transketolase [Phycisphaerales bacterium]